MLAPDPDARPVQEAVPELEGADEAVLRPLAPDEAVAVEGMFCMPVAWAAVISLAPQTASLIAEPTELFM